MAPKNHMKRPAASHNVQAVKKSPGRTRVRSSSGKTLKKPSGCTRSVNQAQCNSIATGLQDAYHALGVVDQTAFELLDLIVKGDQRSEASIVALAVELNGIDEQLQSVVCEQQAKIDNARADEAMRIEAKAVAEASVAELKKNLSDVRSARASAIAAVREAKDRIVIVQVEQTKARTELKGLVNKRARIETAKAELDPLATTTTSAPGGQKRLNGLRRIGKEFGFHEVLLDALPAVLRKQPDRRQTFDALALRQLGLEFSKHGNRADALLREGEVAVNERSAAVKEAEAAAHIATELQKECAQACTQYDIALEKLKDAASVAGAHVRTFGADMRLAKLCLEKRTKQLSAFRSGPLGAFEALRLQQRDRDGDTSGGVKLGELGDNGPVGGGKINSKEGFEAAASLGLVVPCEDSKGHAGKMLQVGSDDYCQEVVATRMAPALN